ncbi:MAG: glycosyltransferase family 9 protein [Candidatus Hydrogenedentes bacterium]|nr:glycosyltransferase family 9 protein [Candidatus Hydrogenedentota bacterium]
MIERRPVRIGVELFRRARWSVRRALRRRLRIVVEIRWRLGDEIMAIPIYEGIKRRFPFCELTVWGNHPDLLLRNPYVDRVVGPGGKPDSLLCDRYIVLRGAPRDVFRLDHYARISGIPTPPMLPRLYYDDWNSDAVARAGLETKSFVAVSTGATWETKRWPIDRWRELCETLQSGGYTPAQLGKGDERIGAAYDFVDRTSVREAACVLRHARLLITCDSGLMHLALAAGTPVLALFGPTDPRILVRNSAPLSFLTNERPCQGCWNHSPDAKAEGVCPLGISPCMGTLAVETVLARARELLGANA